MGLVASKQDLNVKADAIKQDLDQIYVKKTDAAKYALKMDIPAPANLTDYAKRSEIPKIQAPDLSGYAKLSDIPDWSQFARRADIPAQQDLTPYVRRNELPPQQDLTQFARTSDVINWITPLGNYKMPYAEKAYSGQYKDYPSRNLPAFDMVQQDQVDLNTCKDLCNRNPFCTAYFHENSDPNARSKCWLKRINPLDRIMETGVKLGQNQYFKYHGAEWPGNDLSCNSAPSAGSCQAACENNADCTHYSYVAPEMCCLKKLPVSGIEAGITGFKY